MTGRCCPQMVGETRHAIGCWWCSGFWVNEIGIPEAWKALAEIARTLA